MCNNITAGKCVSCIIGFYLLGDKCVQCKEMFSGCTECTSDGVCIKGCSTDCKTCYEVANQCTSCHDGNYLAGSTC